MGTAAILLVFHMSPIIYALTAFLMPVYVPKTPRRLLVMGWPSVMDPSVSALVAEKLKDREKAEEYLKIQCDKESHSEVEPIDLIEVIDALDDPLDDKMQDTFPRKLTWLKTRAPTFSYDVLTEWMTWLSAEALECGFNTIYRNDRHEIYRFINRERSIWINALQKIAYILLKVIAHIHHNTGVSGHWITEWRESYEEWYKEWYKLNKKPLEYLEMYVLNSFDIVIAWLADYLKKWSRVVRHENAHCALSITRMVAQLTQPDEAEYEKEYEENFYTLAVDYIEETCYRSGLLTCEVKSGCYSNEPIRIQTLEINSTLVAYIPKAVPCVLSCTLPMVAWNYEVSDYCKPRLFGIAHMTTVVGHDLVCRIPYSGDHGDLRRFVSQCQPQIVAKYLNDFERKKDPNCWKYATVLHVGTDPDPELVKVTKVKKVTLTKKMTTFPDLED